MKLRRFYTLITFLAFISAFISCASKAESEPLKNNISNTSATEVLARAETLFKQRADISKLREAVNVLARGRNPDARNFEVEWKFAQYNYFLGKLTDNEKESEKAFADGEKAGMLASRLQPNKPDGYFWYAANLGEQAKRAPVTKGLASIDDIQEAMKKVIEIDPTYQSASAFDALGQIELATLLTRGKAEKAVEYLEKGIATGEINSYLHLHLAEAYLAVERDSEAKKHLEIILKMKPDPDYLLEYEETAVKAKKLLETKF